MKLHCCKAFINLVVVIYFNTAGNDIFPFKNCIKCLVQSNIYSLPEFFFSGKMSLCCITASSVLFGELSIHYQEEFPQQSSFIQIAICILSLTVWMRLFSLHGNFFIDRTDLSNVWLNCLVHITRWGRRNSLCTACCFFCTHWFRRLTFNTNFFSFNNLVVFVFY